MEPIWEELYQAARSVIDPVELSDSMSAGTVGAAVLSRSGTIYTGICVDTRSSLGMCAERNAISTMLTHGERAIAKVCSVYRDGTVMAPCGACREFMMQMDREAGDIEVLLDRDRAVRLRELLPACPY